MKQSTQKAINTARHYLAMGNTGAYARIVSSEQRSARTGAAQAKILAVVAEDKTAHLFTITNGCLVAA